MRRICRPEGAEKIVLCRARLRDAVQKPAELSQGGAARDSGSRPGISGEQPIAPENQAGSRGAAGLRLISTIPTDTSAAAPRIPGPMGSPSKSHPRVSPKTGVRNEKLATPDAG